MTAAGLSKVLATHANPLCYPLIDFLCRCGCALSAKANFLWVYGEAEGVMSVFSQEKRYRTSLPASQQQEICSDAAAPALDPA
jgi:hypothetical protein